MPAVILLATLLLPRIGMGQERTFRKTLAGQLIGVAGDLMDSAQNDRKLRGQKFALGKVTTTIPDSSFELAMIQALKSSTVLMPHLSDASQYYLQGEYNYLRSGNEKGHKGVSVLEIVLKITDRFGVTQQSVRREVNETDDIAKVTGATVSVPDTPDFKVRNKELGDSFMKPSFNVVHGTQIAAKGNAGYTVEILRRRDGGDAMPIKPINKGGMAFVDLSVTDTFEIVLRSYDKTCASVGKVSIDGLSVINTFSEDSDYSGYLLGKAMADSPAKHLVPGWMRTTKSKIRNVWRFAIREFGQGAATAMKSKSNLGVITVQFFQAAKPGQSLRGRKFGEVGRGELADVDYKVEPMQLLDTAECTINIRYSVPLRH